jgi:hypothetical protein
MTEKYNVKVELDLNIELPNDSSSEAIIEKYVDKHLKKLLATHHCIAHNREIRSVEVSYCKAELVE